MFTQVHRMPPSPQPFRPTSVSKSYCYSPTPQDMSQTTKGKEDKTSTNYSPAPSPLASPAHAMILPGAPAHTIPPFVPSPPRSRGFLGLGWFYHKRRSGFLRKSKRRRRGSLFFRARQGFPFLPGDANTGTVTRGRWLARGPGPYGYCERFFFFFFFFFVCGLCVTLVMVVFFFSFLFCFGFACLMAGALTSLYHHICLPPYMDDRG